MTSPTVTAEAALHTCVIGAQEDGDITVVVIPNAFIQTVDNEEDAATEHRVIVHIRGPMVDILVSIAPDVYGPCVYVFWPPVKGELLLSMRYQSLVLTSMMSPPYPRPQ